MKKKIMCIIILIILSSLILLCIKRDNPWDPYNICSPEEIEVYKNIYMSSIDSVLKNLSLYNTVIKKMEDTLSLIQLNNERKLEQNEFISDSVNNLLNYNSEIESINNLRECINRIEKKQIFPSYFLSLDLFNRNLTIIEKYIETTFFYCDSLKIVSSNICKDKKVLSNSYIQFVDSSLESIKNNLNKLKKKIVEYNIAMSDSNKKIDSLNRELEKEDSLIYIYNSQISFCKMKKLSDSTQIKEAIRGLKEGDSIALDSGMIVLPEFFISKKGSPDPDKKITIIGDPTGKTIINSPNVVIENSKNIEFIRITFQNSNGEVGVKVQNNSYQIIFSSCSFVNCKKYGCTFENSVVSISNCIFKHNGIKVEDSLLIKQAGLRATNCNNIIIKNSLVVENQGFGIDILSSNVEIINCTIANNSIDGIRYIGPSYTGSLRIKKSIIAFNKGYGIYREKQVTTRDVFIDKSDRFFDNGLGSLFADEINFQNNQQDIVEMDPMFEAPENGDYRIKIESSLYGTDIGYQY